MSREIDERIVEMQFDNKQFETGVAQTLKSLDKLNDSLKFEGLSKSVSAIQNGINRLDFTPISNGVGALEGTLTTLAGRIKLEIFDRLANMAVDTGEKIFKALTLQGAKAGFAEYETQQGAVQTILANTQHLGTTIDDVTAALDDLNEYADLTIYNFTQMTRNIGTFTAAGLDLETSTSAIKGIANLAAISGSTSEQASRAMYQLSQALAAGRVNLMDWNSVVNAGMGGKVFQDALKNTAKHMGIVIDESKSFRESISGGDTWLSAEVLSETLKQLSGDMTEQELAAQGWSASEIEEIQKMAKTAMDAATVVKTFSQLTDTVNEQIGSGWTKTWQLIFGDFEESKELWTSVYKAVSPYIDAMSDLRNQHIQFWKENEGRAKVIEAFSNLWSGASDFIDRFTDSFRKAFPIIDNFGQVLVDISDRFLAFSERFKVVKDRADQITDAFDSVSDAIGKITEEDKKNALDIWNWGNINGRPGRIDGQARVEALGESYDRVQKYINTFIATGYDVAKTDELLGVGADAANSAISQTAKISDSAAAAEARRDVILANLIKTMRNLADVAKVIGGSVLKTVKAAGSAFKDVFDPLMAAGDLNGVSSVLVKVSRAFEITAEKAEDVKRIFRGVFSVFDILYQLIRAVAQAIAKVFVPSLDSVDKASGGILKTLGNFGDWLYSLDQAIKQGDLFSVAIEKMTSFIGSFSDKIRDSVGAFSEWSGIDFGKITSAIGTAIKNGLSKFKDWTGIDIAAIFESIWERVKIFIGYIKNTDFKGAFAYIIGGVFGFISLLKDTISQLDISTIFGKFGDFFTNLGHWIGELFDHAFGAAKSTTGKAVESAKDSFSLLDVLGAIIYGGYRVIQGAIAKIHAFMHSPEVEQLGHSVSRFFSSLFNKDKAVDSSSGEKEKTFLEKLGEALSKFYEDVEPLLGAGLIGAIVKIFSDLSTASKNFSKAPLVLNESIEKLAGSFENMTKAFKIETMSKFMTSLANAVLKLVAAIIILTLLDPDKVAGATAVITGLLAEIVGALTFAQKKLDTELNMAFMVAMLKQIGNTLLVMAAAIFIISKAGDNEKLGGSLFVFTGMMTELGALLYIMSDIVKSKQFRRGGESVVLLNALIKQIGSTMLVMAGVMYILGKINSDNMTTALQGLIGIFAVMALLVTLVAELAKKTGEGKTDEIAALGGAFLAIAGAFALIVPAVALLALIPEEALNKALTAVTAIAAIFAGLMVASEEFSKGGTNSKAILSAGAAMIMIALAMDMILPSIVALALLDPDKLTAGIVAMGTALAILAIVLVGLTTVGGGIAVAALGMLALAAAIAIMTPSLMLFGAAAYPIIEKVVKMLDKTDNKKVNSLAKKILKLAGALTVIGLALVVFGAGLTVVSVALVLIGVAVTLMTPFTAALSGLITALTLASSVWPAIKKMFTELGPAIADGIGGFFAALTNNIGKISDAIKSMAPKVAEAIVVVLDSIFTAIFNWIPGFVETFLQMLNLVLSAIEEYLPEILDKLGVIVMTILDWVSSNSTAWAESLTIIIIGIWEGIFNGLAAKADDLVGAVFDFLIAVFNALANNLETKGDDLLDAIGNFIVEFFKFIKKAAKKYWYFMEDFGGTMIDKIVTGLSNAISKVTKWFKDLITEDIPNALSTVWSDLESIGGDFVTAIVEGLKGAWTTAKDEVIAWANDFLSAIGITWQIESPSKATQELGEYLGMGAAVGIKKSTKSATDAVKKFGEDTMNAMDDALDSDTLDNNFDIVSKVHLDTTEIDTFDIDNMFGNSDLLASIGAGIDTSSMFADLTANTDEQNRLATEDNGSLLAALTEQISGLSDKLDNGMINIPENATFSVPVVVDGRIMATATAPYLDVINGQKLDLESRGVTTR